MENLKWNKVEDLPLDKETYRKVLLLSEGRGTSTNLYVNTNYWYVFFDERDLGIRDFVKKVKLPNGVYSYGKFGEGFIPFDKIKGWMFTEDLISLYNEQEDGEG